MDNFTLLKNTFKNNITNKLLNVDSFHPVERTREPRKAALALAAKLGREDGVRLLSTDSFVRNLLNAQLYEGRACTGGQVWARGRRPSPLSTSSFAKNLLNANFMKAAFALEAKFKRRTASTSSPPAVLVESPELQLFESRACTGGQVGREDGVRLLSTDSFVRNLLNANFMKAALELEAKFGREDGVRLLSTDSFAKNLLNANFMKAALELEAKFGREHGVRLLSTGSFAKNLLNTNFMKAALALEAKFGREDGVRLLPKTVLSGTS